MRHSIDKHSVDESLLPMVEPMIEAIDKCVHCGFCLPTCPTYQLLGQEMDSPRGRIVLMKEVLEGNVEPSDAQPYLDKCLGCVACETSCPSGVEYGKLITPYRAIQRRQSGDPKSGVVRRMIRTASDPARFRRAARLGMLIRPFKKLLPASMRAMIELLPERLPPSDSLAEVYPAQGKQSYRVGLLAGCAQQVVAPEINRATIELLTNNGCQVLVPREQACCGALDWHRGDDERAKAVSRSNLTCFPDDLDAIIVNAAGCGSAIADYELIFSGDVDAEAAKSFADRCVDISVFLNRIGFQPRGELSRVTRIAYQDACHLAHAQKIIDEPRRLLQQIKNLELVPLRDSEICCGSAGTYNIDRPTEAEALGQRKVDRIIESGCEIVVSGNIGCLIQIRRFLKEADSSIRAMHTIEMIASLEENHD